MKKGMQITKYRNYRPLNRNDFIIEILFGVVFLLLAFLNRFKTCGMISFWLFLFYFIIYIIRNKRILMKYMFLFFGIVFYFMGNSICIFSKTYLVELGITSFYNGSLSVLVFSYWIYLNLLAILDWKLAPLCYRNQTIINYKISDALSLNYICIKYGRQLIFILSVFMFMSVLEKPAFILSYNRFEYAIKNLSGFLYKIRTIPILLAPVIVISVLESKKLNNSKSKIFNIILTYFPYILFALWIGNKFGIFWQLFYSLAIPFTIYINIEKIENTSLFIYIIGAVLGLFLVVLVFYIARGNGMDSIIEKLLRRFSAQGQIWWTVFSDHGKKAKGISGFIVEIKDIIISIISKGKIKEYGVYKIMKLYGSPSYIKHYLDIDMRFSAMGFELSYCFFGYLSFLIFPLVTIPVYVFIINFYISSVVNRDFIRAFTLLRILVVYDSGVCQGDWYRFSSKLDILIIFLFVFTTLVRRRDKYFAFQGKDYN